MHEPDHLAMEQAATDGVYPPSGGKWRTAQQVRDEIEIRPVTFAHVDRLTGITLATFDSATEAADALRLVGPLADVEIDAIFPRAEEQ